MTASTMPRLPRAQRPRPFDGPFERFTAACATTPGEILPGDFFDGLTFLWYDASPDPIDAPPRDSAIETSATVVLDDSGTCVAYLRSSFTTDAMLKATFGRLLEWVEENGGWGLGYRTARRGHRDWPTPEQVWHQAHLHARMVPASLRDARMSPWSLRPGDAPTDPAVLEADLVAIEKTLRPRYCAWRKHHLVPFVAYAQVADDRRGTRLGRALYLATARRLATTGRVLRASGNQSPSAQALWARLIADPTVPTDTITLAFWTTRAKTTYPVLDYR